MAIVERPFLLGIDISLFEKILVPSDVKRRVIIDTPGEEEFRLNKPRYLRNLEVYSWHEVVHYTVGDNHRILLERNQVNMANIELEAKRFKFIPVKIRWRPD